MNNWEPTDWVLLIIAVGLGISVVITAIAAALKNLGYGQ